MPSDSILEILNKLKYPKNIEDFDDAMAIFPTKKQVKIHNLEKLQKLNKPIFNMKSSDNSKTQFKSEDFGNMQSNLMLCRGAKVMLNSNINP